MAPHPGPQVLPLGSQPGPWPLHSAAASRQAEAQALAKQPQAGTLMALAGLSVARLALALVPHAQRALLVCGPGNNGGDGLVAARLLQAAGVRVQVVLVGDPKRQPTDAAQALKLAQEAGVPISQGPLKPAHVEGVDLVVDALLGLGASGQTQTSGPMLAQPAREWLAATIHLINAASQQTNTTVLAVNMPSGLQADTGYSAGPVVCAHATLSLLTLKPGCFTSQGRAQCGQMWFDDLAAQHQVAPTAWLGLPVDAAAAAMRPRPSSHNTHKGSYGDVAVVAGTTGMVGAAWLAAGAALAAGAGRVFCSLLTPQDDAAVEQVAPAEIMQRSRWWLGPAEVLGRTTVVCGCGGGSAVGAALPPLLQHAGQLVLDADALNALAADGSLAQALVARAGRGLPTVLTPHPLEAARLLGLNTAAVQADRLAAAAELAKRFGATVVLKGSGTVVAGPTGLPIINSSGNAALATAGTGDVLAGWLGGLWAQNARSAPRAGLADQTHHDWVQLLAATAVWQHGHAADRFMASQGKVANHQPLRASHLIEALISGA